MSSNLMPCPFCGGAAELREDWGQSFPPFVVVCQGPIGCHATSGRWSRTSDAINSWNARVTPSTESPADPMGGWVNDETGESVVIRRSAPSVNLEELAREVICLIHGLRGVECDPARFGRHESAWFRAEVERVTDKIRRHLSTPSIEPTRRIIDGKFHVEGSQIIKTTSGEVVPEDEPLLLFRGRDRLALPTLEHYRKMCADDGCNDFQLGILDARIAAFREYAADPRRMKQPGITRGAAWEPSIEPTNKGEV